MTLSTKHPMRTLLTLAAPILAVLAGPALAHAFLKTVTPAVGGTVQQAPAMVVIDFTEGVEPRFSTITVQDGSGARMDLGDVHLQGGNQHLVVGLKPLPPGVYKVTWTATAVDTHRIQGDYSFTVGK
jgi:methionine-rich copper-binding protein CopC